MILSVRGLRPQWAEASGVKVMEMTLSWATTSFPGYERLEQGLAVEKMSVYCLRWACGCNSTSGTLCRVVYIDGIVSANVNLCFLGFPGGSAGKESPCNAGDPGSIPGLGRSPGEGNGYPLQCSCLENFMNRRAWQDTILGVTKSGTWLSTHSMYIVISFPFGWLKIIIWCCKVLTWRKKHCISLHMSFERTIWFEEDWKKKTKKRL